MIGETIDDRYKLLRLIGEGAMGAVYEASHVNTGRVVAIKLIQEVALSDTDIYARFEREARVAGAIDSRHVASVLDSGRDKTTNLPYIALEMLRGEDLGSYLERNTVLSPGLALRLITQACTGLAKAHAAEVVHRDIKPANIFLALDEDGERVTVKILDFGIAKFRPSGGHGINLTQTGKMLGTPRYMSPEQAQGEKDIDFRTDVWSLGSVLYETLTGRPPHNEPEHIGKLIFSICSTTPPLPSTLSNGLSTEIDQTVMKSLSTSREARHATARELLDELEGLTPEGSDVFADELGLVRRTGTELAAAGETRRISRPHRSSSPRISRSESQPASSPDAKVIVDRSDEDAGIASTLFATNSTLRSQPPPRSPSRAWVYISGVGVGVAASIAAVVMLSTSDPTPVDASSPAHDAQPSTRSHSAPAEPLTSMLTTTPTPSAQASGSSVALLPTQSSRAVRPPTSRPTTQATAIKTVAVPHATSFE